MATVKDMLRCPKCGKKMMGRAHPQKFGKEYFAHCCHLYFGIDELVHQWGYDAADLTPIYPVTTRIQKSRPKTNAPLSMYYAFDPNISHYSEFDGETGEPHWLSDKERNSAYQMVSRMFMGIEEIDDYADMMATYDGALAIGVQ